VVPKRLANITANAPEITPAILSDFIGLHGFCGGGISHRKH